MPTVAPYSPTYVYDPRDPLQLLIDVLADDYETGRWVPPPAKEPGQKKSGRGKGKGKVDSVKTTSSNDSSTDDTNNAEAGNAKKTVNKKLAPKSAATESNVVPAPTDHSTGTTNSKKSRKRKAEDNDDSKETDEGLKRTRLTTPAGDRNKTRIKLTNEKATKRKPIDTDPKSITTRAEKLQHSPNVDSTNNPKDDPSKHNITEVNHDENNKENSNHGPKQARRVVALKRKYFPAPKPVNRSACSSCKQRKTKCRFTTSANDTCEECIRRDHPCEGSKWYEPEKLEPRDDREVGLVPAVEEKDQVKRSSKHKRNETESTGADTTPQRSRTRRAIVGRENVLHELWPKDVPSPAEGDTRNLKFANQTTIGEVGSSDTSDIEEQIQEEGTPNDDDKYAKRLTRSRIVTLKYGSENASKFSSDLSSSDEQNTALDAAGTKATNASRRLRRLTQEGPVDSESKETPTSKTEDEISADDQEPAPNNVRRNGKGRFLKSSERSKSRKNDRVGGVIDTDETDEAGPPLKSATQQISTSSDLVRETSRVTPRRRKKARTGKKTDAVSSPKFTFAPNQTLSVEDAISIPSTNERVMLRFPVMWTSLAESPSSVQSPFSRPTPATKIPSTPGAYTEQEEMRKRRPKLELRKSSPPVDDGFQTETDSREAPPNTRPEYKRRRVSKFENVKPTPELHLGRKKTRDGKRKREVPESPVPVDEGFQTDTDSRDTPPNKRPEYKRRRISRTEPVKPIREDKDALEIPESSP